ncbi:2-C-methyl-D-erythritol 4-phosphate cytidylyltransferase [Sporosalibacterium faouarense]|uniref:2-C-methyl-D-erythritol 4-phosphate cytidylyltransferase n=1 Tax=Sporosalibacterium faouarense TaxID=516123 RepID=UPI00141C10A4|nr:2-C-methyl-D-erythritol 4-phosphate cytidylyltransferase [Sporosalibacterium faouarense]MTI48366.1 2-C-methyl-D-erythritol 4-phosphate cytidylyltransferase [Bacillota bacterium]
MGFKDKYISVVIPAAGMGKRMNSNINKQFMLINDKPVLGHTIEKFCKEDIIDDIVVVVREDEIDLCKEMVIDKYDLKKVSKVIAGGKERQDSVYNGIRSVSEKTDIILIHDGARPFVNNKIISSSIKNTLEYKACVVGVPVKDTIKTVDINNNVLSTPDRDKLWAVQTPQSFDYNLLIKAYNKAKEIGYNATDDSMLVEKLGHNVKMIMGSYDNIKITTPEDLPLGEMILRKQSIGG